MQLSKTKNIIGWILSGLVGLFLLGASGIPKFLDFPGKEEMLEHLGIPLSLKNQWSRVLSMTPDPIVH